MSSSSFWSQVRWRLGGSDSVLNRISDLMQKQIDANSDAQDVTVEEILNPIVTIPSKVMMRDNLFKVALRNITVGQVNYLPVDPDLDLMRLWITNDHGGRLLSDRSFMSNTIQLNGTDQSKLISANDDEGIAGSPIVNRLIDDQYIRVLDNANVRIKEIAATAEGITVFIRIYVESSVNEGTSGKPGVLFSKIDTEQSDYAYAAYLEDDGGLQFFVRNAQLEYFLSAPAGTVEWTNLNLPDYTETNYHPADYYTVTTIPEIPDPTPYTDLAFTFKFSDKRMLIIKNGTLVADSGAAGDPRSSGVVGWWRLNEGGDIGNTTTPPVASYTRTAFNNSSASGATNGTISNATWSVSTTNPQHTFLSFDGSNDFVTIPNYTAISTITAFTISFWYYHRSMPNVDAYLIYKGTVAAANSLLVYAQVTGFVRLSIWNNSATRYDATFDSAFAAGVNRWYHIVAKWTMGQTGKIFVDNVKATGATTTGTLATGSTNMIIGGGVNLAPNGFIHDVIVWDRELSDAEVTSMYGMGHPSAEFPAWKPDPLTEPPAPSPITNPFVSVYNVPLPTTPEQDSTRLHKLSVTLLTENYNVGQGAQGGNIAVGEDTQYYNNNPTYAAGGSSEVVSSYNETTTNASQPRYLKLDSSQFGGERFQTGIDVIGKVVTKVVAKIADVGGAPATGDIVARIVDAGGTPRATSTTVNAANIVNNSGGASTTAWDSSTFTFTGNSYVMATNDRIQFEFDEGGGGGGVGGTEVLFASYNFLNNPIGISISMNNNSKVGEKFIAGAMVGEIITKIIIRICDGTPPTTGPVVAKIVSFSGETVYWTSNTIDAGSLADNTFGSTTGGWTPAEFIFSGNDHEMNADDCIQLQFNYGGAPGKGVYVAESGGSITGIGNVFQRTSAGTSEISRDLIMDVYVLQ